MMLRPLTATAAALLVLTSGCGATDSSTPSKALPSETPSSATPTEPAGLRLVAIGDSIPYNSSEDCPGCTGFVDQYADAVGAANGQPVEVLNESQHTGLDLPTLLTQLELYDEDLASADVIVVGIAHNSEELMSDTPCGAPIDGNSMPDWSVTTEACSRRHAKEFRPKFDELYSHVASLRDGRPTLLVTMNRYNDWIGWPEHPLTDAQARTTALFIRIWNRMICASAEAHGFVCADLSTAFNGKDGMRPSGDLVVADYTHPSQKGNDLIARVLEQLGVRLSG